MFKRSFIPAVVTIIALASCSKDFQELGFQPEGSIPSDNVHALSVGIESGAYVPEDGGTKASTEAVVRVKWEKDDAVSVVNATTKKILGGCLKATEDGVSVTFEGTVTGTINSGDKLYYIYPKLDNTEETAFDDAGYNQSLAGQTYDGNNPGKVSFYGYAEDEADAATATISKKIQFHLVTSYVHLNMSNLPAKGFALSSIDISNVNEGFTWKLSDNTLAATPYAGSNGISVTCTNYPITKAGNAVVHFATPASAASSDARVVTVNKAYTNDAYTKAEREAATYYNQLYTIWESKNVNVKSTSGENTEVEINNLGSTEVAEGILPVSGNPSAEQPSAFASDKPTEISLGGLGTITFNQQASNAIKTNTQNAQSTNVFFKVEDVTKTKPVQDANLVYEITMKTVDGNGTEVFSKDNAGAESEATVVIELGQSVQSVESVSLVDDNGNPINGDAVKDLSFDSTTGKLTFTVVHFSKYAIKYTEKQSGEQNYVAQIGGRKYETLASAIAAARDGNTIQLLKDVALKASEALDINKNNVILDGEGHTITLDDTDTNLAKYKEDGDNKKYGSFQMIKVTGNDVVLRNLTLDSKDYRGVSLATTWGGKNATYQNIVYKGKGSGHYYGYAAGEGTLAFIECTFETCGYAIHTAESTTDLVVTDCNIDGWVSYGDKTKSASFTNCKFYKAEDKHNGTLATVRPYCSTTFTGCSFSSDYLTDSKYTGITVRSNVVVSLENCTVDGGGNLYELANITNPDDAWVEGGVLAIAAEGDATNGFTAGTFVAKQVSDIKVAPSYRANAVEGKNNVYTVSVIPPAAMFNGQEYPSFEAALNAAKAAKGGKVTLVDDVTLTRTDYKGCSSTDEDFATRLYTIDLYGHKISGGLFAFEDCSYTIEDSVDGGSISRDGSCLQLNVSQFMASKMCTFGTCPTFTVKGGEFIGAGDLENPYSCKYGAQIGAMGTYDNTQAVCKFLISGGKIRNVRIYNGQGEISGGTFEGQLKIEVCTEGSDKYASGITYADFVTTITGGIFNLAETNPIFGADYAKEHLAEQLCIKGGTFNFNPSVNYSACIPAEYTSQDNGDDTWTVVKEEN